MKPDEVGAEVVRGEDSLLKASWRRVARQLDCLAREIHLMCTLLDACGYPASAAGRLAIRDLARLPASDFRDELLNIYESHLGGLGLQTGPGVDTATRIGLAQHNIKLVLAWQALVNSLDQHLVHQKHHRKYAD